ncbi:MarR family transcriptional regulator [Gordonia sp. PKS22-38]|uniref:MarR family transcriptional regulator n=1 Tax=Gordonia prachuapensis TaxID=3115651 RepID=A0ABU7MUQ0_9ACTN|nr:MarR family transcriptional regulator [Gordonia sp. PKS22-38]
MDIQLAQRLSVALLPMARLIRTAVRAAPPLPVVPYAQVEVLRVVQDRPGISVGGVAEMLQLAPNTVSTLVKALVSAGLVDQQAVAGRGRTTTLSLTRKAEEMIEIWDRRRAEILGDVLDSMSPAAVQQISDALPHLLELQQALEEKIADLRG